MLNRFPRMPASFRPTRKAQGRFYWWAFASNRDRTKIGLENPRSTVGTVTEIYDYLRVLFARVGVPHCHKCGKAIGSQTAEQMVNRVLELPKGTRFML